MDGVRRHAARRQREVAAGRSAARTIRSFLQALEEGTTLAWCVRNPRPVEALEDAWSACRDDAVMRHFLRRADAHETWRDAYECRRMCEDFECAACVEKIRTIAPSIRAIATAALGLK